MLIITIKYQACCYCIRKTRGQATAHYSEQPLHWLVAHLPSNLLRAIILTRAYLVVVGR